MHVQCKHVVAHVVMLSMNQNQLVNHRFTEKDILHHIVISTKNKMEKDGWGGEEDEIKQEKRQRTTCLVHSASMCSSVVRHGPVDPALEVGHAGEHVRDVHFAGSGYKGRDAHQGPHPTSLTHQRTTGVTLEKTHSHN